MKKLLFTLTIAAWILLPQPAAAAVPTFVAASASAAAGTGDCTPALPAGHQTDDILLLVVETLDTETPAAPSGYAEVADSPVTIAGTGLTKLSVFWKRHDGSESDPTITDPGDHCIAAIAAFRGVITTGDPWDVTAALSDDTGNSTVTFPADTTTVAETLIVLVQGTTSNVSISGHTNANLANLAEGFDFATTQGADGGVKLAYGDWSSSGDFGATTATQSSNTQENTMSIALKPPAAGGGSGAARGFLFGFGR